MKDESLTLASSVATIQFTLKSLRGNDIARALEMLEMSLDTSVLELSALSKDKDVAPVWRNHAIKTLKQISAYRRAHPRRCEADLNSWESALALRHPAETASEMAGKINRSIEMVREMAGKILEEIGE
jgi:hypothetical protein